MGPGEISNRHDLTCQHSSRCHVVLVHTYYYTSKVYHSTFDSCPLHGMRDLAVQVLTIFDGVCVRVLLLLLVLRNPPEPASFWGAGWGAKTRLVPSPAV